MTAVLCHSVAGYQEVASTLGDLEGPWGLPCLTGGWRTNLGAPVGWVSGMVWPVCCCYVECDLHLPWHHCTPHTLISIWKEWPGHGQEDLPVLFFLTLKATH